MNTLMFFKKPVFDGYDALIGQSYLEKAAECLAMNRSEWIDTHVFVNLPSWKSALLRMYPYKFITKILGINIEIVHERLVAGFGESIKILINKRIVAERKFKV